MCFQKNLKCTITTSKECVSDSLITYSYETVSDIYVDRSITHDVASLRSSRDLGWDLDIIRCKVQPFVIFFQDMRQLMLYGKSYTWVINPGQFCRHQPIYTSHYWVRVSPRPKVLGTSYASPIPAGDLTRVLNLLRWVWFAFNKKLKVLKFNFAL